MRDTKLAAGAAVTLHLPQCSNCHYRHSGFESCEKHAKVMANVVRMKAMKEAEDAAFHDSWKTTTEYAERHDKYMRRLDAQLDNLKAHGH